MEEAIIAQPSNKKSHVNQVQHSPNLTPMYYVTFNKLTYIKTGFDLACENASHLLSKVFSNHIMVVNAQHDKETITISKYLLNNF
jgi:hypothetical protein